MTTTLQNIWPTVPKLIILSFATYVLVYMLGWYALIPLGLLIVLLAGAFMYLRQGAIRDENIEAALRSTPPDWIEDIYSAIATIGTSPSNSYFLTGQDWSKFDDSCRIELPPDANVDWMRSQILELKFSDTPVASSLQSLALKPSDGNSDFRLLPIPRVTNHGRIEHVDDPKDWLQSSPKLRSLAEQISAKHPEQVLRKALGISGRVNEPVDPSAEGVYSLCPACGTRMQPVLHLEVGSMHPGQLYFLEACNCSPDAFAVNGEYRPAHSASAQP